MTDQLRLTDIVIRAYRIRKATRPDFVIHCPYAGDLPIGEMWANEDDLRKAIIDSAEVLSDPGTRQRYDMQGLRRAVTGYALAIETGAFSDRDGYDWLDQHAFDLLEDGQSEMAMRAMVAYDLAMIGLGRRDPESQSRRED